MYCSSCGEKLTESTQFCPACGQAVVSKISNSVISDSNYERPTFSAPGLQSNVASSQIALWRPGVAASLSVLLSGAFGAYIHSRNWAALGEAKRSSNARLWMWAIIIALVVASFASDFFVAAGVGFWSLLLWYFISGKSQIKHAQAAEPYASKSWPKPVLVTIGIILLVSFAIGAIQSSRSSLSSTSATEAGSTDSGIQKHGDAIGIGETFRDGDLSVAVEDVRKSVSVGGEYFASRPANGGIYVVVTWSYRNDGSKPINAFSTPSLILVDGAGNEYKPDIAATAAYATAANLSEKVLSDINPGIGIRTASVFEIAQSLYDPSTWHVRIQGDETFDIALNKNSFEAFPAKNVSPQGPTVDAEKAISEVPSPPLTSQEDVLAQESATPEHAVNKAKNCGSVPVPSGIIGMPYSAAKRMLTEIGYRNVSGVDAEHWQKWVGGDPSDCGNAACSVPFVSSAGEGLMLYVQPEGNDPEITDWNFEKCNS